ncbi:hypothetical protein NKG94_28330 [Micromonospora sp. M12]
MHGPGRVLVPELRRPSTAQLRPARLGAARFVNVLEPACPP